MGNQSPKTVCDQREKLEAAEYVTETDSNYQYPTLKKTDRLRQPVNQLKLSSYFRTIQFNIVSCEKTITLFLRP